ncbi:hypothetical protein C8R43DRAFT_153323 [Mycena crocata]|nr:hypothetical protein C8R43DRAFT_153323 [Mycena crocata]
MMTDLDLDTIDIEIAWHLSRVYALRRHRNNSVPIFRLPNEIIGRIFLLCGEEARERHKLGLLSLILVCRRWHDLARLHRQLWSFIHVFSHQDGRLIPQLNYSHPAPLTIKFDHYLEHHSFSILPCTSRFLDLDIRGAPIVLWDFMHQLATYDLPMLERLVLDPGRIEELAPSFPDEFFQRAPCLRSLGLRDIPLHWSSLQNLTDISLISCLESTTSHIPTFSSLLSTLRASPKLRTLCLEDVVEFVDGSHGLPIVDLPSLHSLTLHDKADASTQLLQHIAYPVTTRISLHVGPISMVTELAPLFGQLRLHLRAPGAPMLRLFAVVEPGTYATGELTQFSVSAYSATSPPLLNEHRHHADMHLFCLPVSQECSHEIAARFLDVLPAAHITHLDARHAAALSQDSWAALVALLPAVDSLYLRLDGEMHALVGALRVLHLERSGSGSGLGSGGRARIKYIHVEAYRPSWLREEELEVMLPGRDALFELLRLWAQGGIRLERLDVCEWNGCMRMVEEEWEALGDIAGTWTRTIPLFF